VKDGATGTIYQQAIGMVGTGLINAGVSTAFNGGSFGQAFLNNLVAQAAALGAKEIGASTDELSLKNVASHAALGCAAQSAMGGDCAGGAIGGATSAVVAPLVRDGLYDGTQKVETTFNADGTVTTTTSYTNPTYNAVTAAIAMLAGSGAAAVLGRDANSAASAAQNEAVNNSMSAKTRTLMNRAYSFVGQPASALNAADIRQTIMELNVAAQDPNLTVQERNWLHNAALNAYIAGGQAGVLPVDDFGLTYNALIASMGFSGGGAVSLPSAGAQSNVLPTTTGSRTAVTLDRPTSTSGKLTIGAGEFSPSERIAAQYMADLGNEVLLRSPVGTRAGGGTSDLLVNGVPYDVYTPTTSNPNRIVSAIASKNTQASGIVLDLTNSTVTPEQLGSLLQRVRGAGATNITDIKVIKK